ESEYFSEFGLRERTRPRDADGVHHRAGSLGQVEVDIPLSRGAAHGPDRNAVDERFEVAMAAIERGQGQTIGPDEIGAQGILPPRLPEGAAACAQEVPELFRLVGEVAVDFDLADDPLHVEVRADLRSEGSGEERKEERGQSAAPRRETVVAPLRQSPDPPQSARVKARERWPPYRPAPSTGAACRCRPRRASVESRGSRRCRTRTPRSRSARRARSVGRNIAS